MDTDQLVSIAGSARLCEVTARTIHNHINAGTWPAPTQVIEGRKYFDKGEVVEWKKKYGPEARKKKGKHKA